MTAVQRIKKIIGFDSRGPTISIGLLAVWTFVAWGPRIRNIWDDDALSVGGQLWRTAIALFFLGAAAVMVLAWLRRHPQRNRIATGFAVWTVGYWILRMVIIVTGDHSVGFILVHAALALVSGVLAVGVISAQRRKQAEASA
ncbi:MAG: hypothetical protein HKN26_08140 [Acidimicrobiales bacterium]|nr:hypothetical protein [Acidimicrobiales bacterium]